jgi:hypothetical protein
VQQHHSEFLDCKRFVSIGGCHINAISKGKVALARSMKKAHRAVQ